MQQEKKYQSIQDWYDRNKNTKCLIPDCDGDYRSKGYCKKHYSRFMRYGDPNILKHQPNGSPHIKRYRKKRIGEKTVSLHRWVVEQHIKRKLLPTEIIHHKNGNKLDNRIENLQIMKDQKEHEEAVHKKLMDYERAIEEGKLVWINPGT
jgi:HNH endonuclease